MAILTDNSVFLIYLTVAWSYGGGFPLQARFNSFFSVQNLILYVRIRVDQTDRMSNVLKFSESVNKQRLHNIWGANVACVSTDKRQATNKNAAGGWEGGGGVFSKHTLMRICRWIGYGMGWTRLPHEKMIVLETARITWKSLCLGNDDVSVLLSFKWLLF